MQDHVLLLWDIDGTLFTSKAGQLANLRALEEEFGRRTEWRREFHGTTDGFICRELLKEYGCDPTEERVHQYRDNYLKLLQEELQTAGHVVHTGVRELLEHLSQHPRIKMGLLTGNWSAASEIKLRHAGLDKYFEFGAFSDDSIVRNDLGPIAQRKAREIFGTDFSIDQIWIIGDTPNDIACAKAFGARCLAVATGTYSAAELESAGADAVFTDFSDPERFLEVVSATRPGAAAA